MESAGIRRLICAVVLAIATTPLQSLLATDGTCEQRLTEQWEFYKGDLGGVWEALRVVNSSKLPAWQEVNLPHCFNTTDAVDPDVVYYQGPGWYRTNLKIDNPYQEGRTLLRFEGAGQKTQVYIGSVLVQEHVGGYDEFRVDITTEVESAKRADGTVPLIVRCDNSRDLEMIPSDLSDFNLYGGLYRNVNLVYVPSVSIDEVQLDTHYEAASQEAYVLVRAILRNSERLSEGAVLEIEVTDQEGNVAATKQHALGAKLRNEQLSTAIKLKSPAPWSPNSPTLYSCIIRLKDTEVGHEVTRKIGFREFQFKKKGPFFLNGERLLLRGTHRHEDHAGLAAAMPERLLRKEFELMKDAGINFIRLGHYQQSRVVLDLCDQLGFLVWEEIPWCRGGLGGEKYRGMAKRMLRNMITQHRHHPSIILWGLGNENDWPGDFPEFEKGEIRAFMTELHQLVHQLDPSRLTSIRRCAFCADIVDVYSPSIWAGWYSGKYTDYQQASRREMEKVDHFFHAEWGASHHARRHSEDPDRGLSTVASGDGTERAGDYLMSGGKPRVSKDSDWTESYACNLIDWHLKEQETMPWLTGSAYWPFKDFSTPLRPTNPVPYVNQKGIVERDLTRKESYYVFQSYWSDEPMVHIYGHTWPVRWGAADEQKLVKVYSNCPEVELFLNGQSVGKRLRESQNFPAAGLRWLVRFAEGKNELKAVVKSAEGDRVDEMSCEYQTQQWGKPVKLELKVKKNNDDLATIQAYALDASGVRCLDATQFVRFELAGDGELIADQGTSTASRKVQLYNGRANISLHKNDGESYVSVSSAGLDTEFIFVE